jgi:chromosome segregation protein
MYLKSLQLVGFKSFAEKTTLDFLPGVTAIVGPNGCGKSNVSDAIRWVLGEQSAKALRGAEMADCIFSGTDGRKPIGMAEVSLTFADVDPKLVSLPGVNLDFTEITVTRRVYRDGTGEYLINKTPCRLRDIQQMFMDTGIGRSSYSMMAQGQIDQILSAHPEDRRNIFEEAAGINKYKHQKKEALRKLEYTEQNLMRLTDIIKEVKRQIISLQRQAGKARRYKELFDELKALDTRLQRHRYDLLHADIAGLEAQLASLAAQADQFASEIAGHETQIAQLRQSLQALDQTVSDAVARDHELKSETDRHQQRIGFNTQRIAESEQRITDSRLQIAGSEEKIRIQENTLAQLNAEFDQIAAQHAAAQAQVETQQATLQAHDATLAGKRAELQQAGAALIALESENAHHRNELGALDHKKKHDRLRAEKLSTEKIALEEQRRALEERLAAFNGSLTDLRRSVESAAQLLTDQETELTGVQDQLRQVVHDHQTAIGESTKQSARLEVLRQVFAAPDGRATLGNILEVEPPFGPAIEAALNHNLRTILADDLATARSLITGNLPVAAPELAGPRDLPVATGTATAQPALDVVRIRDERFTPLLRSLLANVVIVDNLDAALAQRAPGVAVATVAGEFVNAHGILSAVTTSYIGEITTLTESVTGLHTRTTDLAARRRALETQRDQLEDRLRRVREQLHGNEVALASREGELSALTAERRDLESKIHTVIYELTGIEQQNLEEQKRRQELNDALAQAQSRENAWREQVASAQTAVNELSAQRDAHIAILTELRVAVGGIQHKRGAIDSQREPIAGRIRDLRELIQTGGAEITTHTARIEQCRAEIAESEQKIVELAAAREQSQQQLAGWQHQRDEVATGIQHAEDELRALRRQAADALQQRSGFDVALAQKRMEIQNLKDRVWQKYQLNVEDLRSESQTITIADGHGPVTRQEVPVPVDWDAIEIQAAELQSKLDAMGPVNVEAIQEYDELEERYRFLSQQHEDLVKAKEQLLQVIAKINTTTRELFAETFAKIRENFQGMFTELFGGGKANLILTDENDPLESGIEIVAKPPGKQLQSITLLSGGEKTLTATALLFAIYMVKPSPFCVLDELDAPLDESNINRFIRILQRFVSQSQFVVITHNKRTIGMADALYGVTMEEHGVSKIVSVKFSPREEQARKAIEQARETQEDRIDGAAAVRTDVRPHEEELRNDLLIAKESTIAAIPDAPPVVAEVTPTLSAAPAPIADEVQAVVAAVQAANATVQETLAPQTELPTPPAS